MKLNNVIYQFYFNKKKINLFCVHFDFKQDIKYDPHVN